MSRDEYYALLREAHERVDWANPSGIHAYNQYARELRKQISEEVDNT